MPGQEPGLSAFPLQAYKDFYAGLSLVQPKFGAFTLYQIQRPVWHHGMRGYLWSIKLKVALSPFTLLTLQTYLISLVMHVPQTKGPSPGYIYGA